MEFASPSIFLFFFLNFAGAVLLATCNNININGSGGFKMEETEESHINKSDFPSGFLFGAGTSAYQVEGAYLEDNKSLSNWDAYCHSLGCGRNGENGDTANDHYHLFLKDIEMIHSLGLQAYRFSISWARILPKGRLGGINPAGIMFYNKILDNLILRGIEPIVTVFHYDFPQEFEERFGSWLNPEMQEEFVHMAEICFKYFGDRVKYWITVNEPNSFAQLAYGIGIFPPSHCSEPYHNCHAENSDMEPLIVTHNMLLAHGKASKLYHKSFQPKQGGLIGLAVSCMMLEPLTDSELDCKAAKRGFAFGCGWSLDPSIFGDYSEEMHEYLGNKLPSFSLEEKKFMKNSIDFIGINHYSTSYVKDCPNSSCLPYWNLAIQGIVEIVGERDCVFIGEPTAMGESYVVPRGLEEIVNIIKIRYNNKPMFILENGYPSLNLQEERVNVLIEDVKRVEYHTTYLASLAKSIRDGADVRGYFIWSLMDSYEWMSGYNLSYGLYHVDRQTLIRTPKLSARWYKNFLTNISDLYDKEVSRDIRSF